jgi:hypothetical protein
MPQTGSITDTSIIRFSKLSSVPLMPSLSLNMCARCSLTQRCSILIADSLRRPKLPADSYSRCGRSFSVLRIIIARLPGGGSMTAVEVLFRYGMSPGEMEMGALGQVSDVYGIRRVRFSEPERTIRVEYDATRLNESSVEKLLRSAGFDIREKLALV